MTNFLKDPLLHFLILGAALFAVSLWRDDQEAADRILISEAQVERISAATALMRGRPPTEEELAEVIEPTIRDEVFYREALALGLDVDDDEVRRRLIEKMQYLTENLADPEPPSDEALRRYYEERPQLFTVPETVTFEQVFFSPQMRGDAVDADAAAALDALQGGADAAGVGDRTPLGLRFDDAPRERVEVLFSDALTGAVFTMEPGQWQGPYRSDFGLHVVRLLERSPARLPSYDEARAQVASAYAAEQRAERNAVEYARMRSRYDVVIEWPAALRGEDEG
jgi:peptidyl-prolyl cis-trans isomerase C